MAKENPRNKIDDWNLLENDLAFAEMSEAFDRAEAILRPWFCLLSEGRYEEVLVGLKSFNTKESLIGVKASVADKARGFIEDEVLNCAVMAYACLGKYEEACWEWHRELYAIADKQEHFLDILAHSPISGAAEYVVSLLVEKGFYDQALSMSTWALARWPELHTLWCYRSSALTYMRKKDEAIACARQALKINPDSGLAWYALGHTYHSFGEYELAACALRMARDFDPSGYNIFLQRELDNIQKYLAS